MPYAEVAVNAPSASSGRSFSYSVPLNMDLPPGQAVRVPFGSRLLEGIVIELTDAPAFEPTRDISGPIEDIDPIPPERLRLGRWISSYYLAPLFDCLALMLPPGFERRSIAFLTLADSQRQSRSSDLTLSDDQASIVHSLQSRERISLDQLEKELGERRAQNAVTQLIRSGLLRKTYELASAKVKPKTELYVSLDFQPDEKRLLDAIGKSTKRRAVANLLIGSSGPRSWREIVGSTGATKTILDHLVRAGLVRVSRVPVTRDPLVGRNLAVSRPLNLTDGQESVLSPIVDSLTNHGTNPSSVFLLHGVTGSGKTEIYLQALTEAIRIGKRGIVLSPGDLADPSDHRAVFLALSRQGGCPPQQAFPRRAIRRMAQDQQGRI